MKKIILLITLIAPSFGFAQHFMYDFRSVPESEVSIMKENERHFWRLVAQDQIKKENLTGWAMLERVGGTADEPNIMFFIGIGNEKNVANLETTFQNGSQNVLNAIGPDAAVFVQRALNAPSFRVGQVILKRTNWEADSDWKFHNYVKLNLSKITNVAKMNELQGTVWGKYINKMMVTDETSQKIWTTAQVLSPLCSGYNWNYLSADGYMSYDDVLDGGWKKTPKIPDLTEINSLMGGGFYKQVTWKVLMSVNTDGEFRVH